MFQECSIHIDLQDISHFDSLIFLNTFMWNFIYVFLLSTLAFMLVPGLICFCIFRSSVPVFVEILSFGFCLVIPEFGAYIAVDHSLVHSYPKIFLLYLSLILILIAGLKSSLSIHMSASFSFIF